MCQPTQLNAIQTIMKISQMILHRIILLRFVFLSLRQCTVWNNFVYAISSQLFEVFHSGFYGIFASKSVINIDFLKSSFCDKYSPTALIFSEKWDPRAKYLYPIETLQIPFICPHGGWIWALQNMAYCHFEMSLIHVLDQKFKINICWFDVIRPDWGPQKFSSVEYSLTSEVCTRTTS